MKIKLQQRGTHGDYLFEYESDLVPIVGDIYAGIDMPDHVGRTVIERLIIPNVPNAIVLYVDYSFPQFSPPQKTSDLEGDLLATKFVS